MNLKIEINMTDAVNSVSQTKRITDYVREATPSLFNNPTVFTDQFIPDEFMFRDAEIEEIVYNLKAFFQNIPPNHIHIYGPPSTGKSHIIRKIVEELNEMAEAMGLSILYVYTNCHDTTLTGVYTKVAQHFDPSFPNRGVGREDIKNFIKQKISGMKIVFIFDEIDKMASSANQRKPVSTLINTFTRLSEDNRFQSQVSIVVISNSKNIVKEIDSATKSTFQPLFIIFREYNAPEITDILLDRCRRGFKEGIIEDAIIKHFGANLRSENRDLRTGLKVFLMAGRNAGNNGGDTITYDDIRYALDQVEKNIIRETIHKYSDQEVMIIHSLAVACSEKREPNSKDLFRAYSNTVKLYGLALKPLTWKHISTILLPKMEVQGWFIKDLKSMGYGEGVTNIYKMDNDEISEILKVTRAELKLRCEGFP